MEFDGTPIIVLGVYTDGSWKEKIKHYQNSFPLQKIPNHEKNDTFVIKSNHLNWESFSDFIFEQCHYPDDLIEMDFDKISEIELKDIIRPVPLYVWNRYCHKLGSIVIIPSHMYDPVIILDHLYIHEENGFVSIFLEGDLPLIEDYFRGVFTRDDSFSWNYRILEND